MEYPDWQKEIFEKYPSVFVDVGKSPRESCMAFGLECAPGWKEPLHRGCMILEKIFNQTGIRTKAEQVKEKFGGLRFYYSIEVPEELAEKANTDLDSLKDKKERNECYNAKNRVEYFTELIGKVVSVMEYDCDTSCETCGEVGEPRGGGWIVTLCDGCHSKNEEEKAKKRAQYEQNKLNISGESNR